MSRNSPSYNLVHGVEAYSSQFPRNDLDGEPAALLELVSLRFGDKLAPDVEVAHGPRVWPAGEDVVRHNVVVAKSGHNGYHKVTRPMARAGLAKDLDKLGDHKFVLVDNLLVRPRYLLVVVVAGRVAGPDDKVDLILDVVVYPLERLVDEGIGRVASRRLCAVDASRAALAMACGGGGGAGIRLVEGVGVEVCTMTLAGGERGRHGAGGGACIPVICRNLPVSLRGPAAAMPVRLL